MGESCAGGAGGPGAVDVPSSCASGCVTDFETHSNAEHIEALYLHIPFCVSRCAYCGFYSQAVCTGDARIAEYVTFLRNLVHRLGSVGLLSHVRTAYVGGGTPTLAGAGLVALAREVASWCPGLVEFTTEANPDSLTPVLAAQLRARGVTRVSLGVQSLCDAELHGLGRAHTRRQALDAAGHVKAAGLDLSCDLMCGIPGQTMESWRASLSGVVEAGADHVSCYPLSIEEGTPFDDRVLAGTMQIPDADLQADMMLEAARVLGEAGLARYEVASYARPGHVCRHNIAYWTGVPYLGLGAAAASMLTPGLACRVGECLGLEVIDEGRDAVLGMSAGDDARDVASPSGTAVAGPACDGNLWDSSLCGCLARHPAAARVRLAFPDSSELLMRDASEGLSFPVSAETLTSREAAAEDLMLAMRMVRGASGGQLARCVEQGIPARCLTCAIDLAVRDGFAERTAQGGLRPTQRGWLLGNELFGIMWDTARD